MARRVTYGPYPQGPNLLTTIAPGTSLGDVDRVRRSRNNTSGLGGRFQIRTQAGWHPLSHAGRVEGIVIADYEVAPQVRTQPGVRPALQNIYSIHYRNSTG